MASEWRVMCNYAGMAKFWQVYRIRDTSQVDHTGNREIIRCFDTEEEAEKHARYLNSKITATETTVKTCIDASVDELRAARAAAKKGA